MDWRCIYCRAVLTGEEHAEMLQWWGTNYRDVESPRWRALSEQFHAQADICGFAQSRTVCMPCALNVELFVGLQGNL